MSKVEGKVVGSRSSGWVGIYKEINVEFLCNLISKQNDEGNKKMA